MGRILSASPDMDPWRLFMARFSKRRRRSGSVRFAKSAASGATTLKAPTSRAGRAFRYQPAPRQSGLILGVTPRDASGDAKRLKLMVLDQCHGKTAQTSCMIHGCTGINDRCGCQGCLDECFWSSDLRGTTPTPDEQPQECDTYMSGTSSWCVQVDGMVGG